MNRKPNKKIFRKILINNQVIIINAIKNKNKKIIRGNRIKTKYYLKKGK